MSHFTVLVVADNKDELADKLLPYHEYEVTGFEAFTEFVVKYKKDNFKSAAAVIMDQCPKHRTSVYQKCFVDGDFVGIFNMWHEKGTVNEDGDFGYLTNPNARWDHWVLGGRWPGLLPIKQTVTVPNVKVGQANIPFDKHSDKEPTRADYAPAGAVDWDKLDRSSYPTFALIDKEGNWDAIGKMGSMGRVTYERSVEDYAKDFWKLIDSLDEDQMVYVVDCHI